MDWNAAADAAIKVFKELGIPSGLGLAAVILVWKALDAWGKSRAKKD